jgi:predicted enzyme related to lactoylglutathione lyase
MSSVGVMNKKEVVPEVLPVDMKLEVVLLDVSDVDRAKAFYEKLGWRLDIDVANGGFRGVQMTPHNSNTSIIFGKGVTWGKSGALNMILTVGNIDAARDDLIVRGVDVSEVFLEEVLHVPTL